MITQANFEFLSGFSVTNYQNDHGDIKFKISDNSCCDPISVYGKKPDRWGWYSFAHDGNHCGVLDIIQVSLHQKNTCITYAFNSYTSRNIGLPERIDVVSHSLGYSNKFILPKRSIKTQRELLYGFMNTIVCDVKAKEQKTAA